MAVRKIKIRIPGYVLIEAPGDIVLEYPGTRVLVPMVPVKI